MKLNIQVHDISMIIFCGNGNQTFKWLGLAVADRYYSMIPHGRSRTREKNHFKLGFYLPSSIIKISTNEELQPYHSIKEYCKDGEKLTVILQLQMPVNEYGTPIYSNFMVNSFIDNDISKKIFCFDQKSYEDH